MKNQKFSVKQFTIITLIVSIWINIAEFLRGTFVVMPKIVSFFEDKNFPIIGMDNAETSNLVVWFIWDMLLTSVLVFFVILCINTFGNTIKSIVIAATATTIATLGICWIAMINMGLGEWSMTLYVFPIAWVGLLIGAWITSKLYKTGRWIK